MKASRHIYSARTSTEQHSTETQPPSDTQERLLSQYCNDTQQYQTLIHTLLCHAPTRQQLHQEHAELRQQLRAELQQKLSHVHRGAEHTRRENMALKRRLQQADSDLLQALDTARREREHAQLSGDTQLHELRSRLALVEEERSRLERAAVARELEVGAENAQLLARVQTLTHEAEVGAEARQRLDARVAELTDEMEARRVCEEASNKETEADRRQLVLEASTQRQRVQLTEQQLEQERTRCEEAERRVKRLQCERLELESTHERRIEELRRQIDATSKIQLEQPGGRVCTRLEYDQVTAECERLRTALAASEERCQRLDATVDEAQSGRRSERERLVTATAQLREQVVQLQTRLSERDTEVHALRDSSARHGLQAQAALEQKLSAALQQVALERRAVETLELRAQSDVTQLEECRVQLEEKAETIASMSAQLLQCKQLLTDTQAEMRAVHEQERRTRDKCDARLEQVREEHEAERQRLLRRIEQLEYRRRHDRWVFEQQQHQQQKSSCDDVQSKMAACAEQHVQYEHLQRKLVEFSKMFCVESLQFTHSPRHSLDNTYP